MLLKARSESKGEMMTMKRLAIGFLVLLAFALHGCYGLFEDSEPFKRARETKALSLLKKYQTAALFHAAVCRVEKNSFDVNSIWRDV